MCVCVVRPHKQCKLFKTTSVDVDGQCCRKMSLLFFIGSVA